MWKTSLVALFLCATNTVFSQAIQQVPQPLQQTATAAPSELDAGNDNEKLFHLRQAAEHLEKAGLKKEAEKIRQLAKSGSENAATVMVNLTMVEVSLSKLQKSGFSMEKLIPNGLSSPNNGSAMLKADDPYFSILKALEKDRLAKIIAAPKLVTESGREAFIRSGSQNEPVAFKNPIPAEEFQKLSVVLERLEQPGTSIDVRPDILDNETIRLAVRGNFSELDKKHSVNAGGTTIPGVKNRSFCTTCDIKNGHVMVINGLVQKNENQEEVALLVLLKAEIVEPVQTAAKPDSTSPLQ